MDEYIDAFFCNDLCEALGIGKSGSGEHFHCFCKFTIAGSGIVEFTPYAVAPSRNLKNFDVRGNYLTEMLNGLGR